MRARRARRQRKFGAAKGLARVVNVEGWCIARERGEGREGTLPWADRLVMVPQASHTHRMPRSQVRCEAGEVLQRVPQHVCSLPWEAGAGAAAVCLRLACS